MRKLATIRRIKNIAPIQGADAIEVATVDGWNVVIKKDEFQVGDLAIYLEVDSWVPHALAPFLSHGQEPKEYDGVYGNRLRTIKLRGQISQGLLLPINMLMLHGCDRHFVLGEDVTEHLGIIQWEAPVPTQLAGEVRGSLPTPIPVTDEERIQNLSEVIYEKIANQTFEKTIKLDGTSMTVYRLNDDHGVAGRNWNYYENATNTLWRVARKNNLLEALIAYGKNIALRGELIGEGIQENNEKIKGHEFYLFNIWDIDHNRYMSPKERDIVVEDLKQLGAKIKQVPSEGFITFGENVSVEDILKLADGKSLFANNREGLVFKRMDGNFSFKAISNWYLLKHGNR